MRIQSELCHISNERVIVRISAWNKDYCLGSTLVEAKNVNLAEEEGIKKLKIRLKANDTDSFDLENNKQDLINNTKIKTENDRLNKEKPIVNEKSIVDWSDELIILDEELKRIGWKKKEEEIYLKKSYGNISRSKITDIKQIYFLIQKLKTIDSNTSPEVAEPPINIEYLINEGDDLLKKLGWNEDLARNTFYEINKKTSRKDATISELSNFNDILKATLKNNIGS